MENTFRSNRSTSKVSTDSSVFFSSQLHRQSRTQKSAKGRTSGAPSFVSGERPARYGNHAASAATTLSTRRKELFSSGASPSTRRHQKRLMHLFFTVARVVCFAAAMRRVVRRHREWVRRETVVKPRAAFVIQTFWRARKRRQRVAQYAALRILVPFFRQRIQRIIAARKRSALLLQRVFRSQRERHFVHWLYKQMQWNKALYVLRLRLKRYMACRYRSFLAQRRDERAVFFGQCAMATQALVREERVEILQILQSANAAGVTPVVTRAMLCADIARITGHDAEDKKVEKGVSWTSVLHSSEGACKLISDLFLPKDPPYPVVGGRRNTHTPDNNSAGIHAHNKTWSRSLPSSILQGSASRSLSRPHTRDSLSNSSSGESDDSAGQGNGALGTSHFQRDEVLDAFLLHLVRTESLERRALQASLVEWREQVMQHIAWFTITVRAAQSVPPIFVPLLVSISEDWLVRRAARLFCEEHAARTRIILDYQSTPLHFLNRPLINFSAEERRRKLVRWTPCATNEWTNRCGTSTPVAHHHTSVNEAPASRANPTQTQTQEQASEKDRVARPVSLSPVAPGGPPKPPRPGRPLPPIPDSASRGPPSRDFFLPKGQSANRPPNAPLAGREGKEGGGERREGRESGERGRESKERGGESGESGGVAGAAERPPVPLLRRRRPNRHSGACDTAAAPRAPPPAPPEPRAELFARESGLDFVCDARARLLHSPDCVWETRGSQ